MFAEARAGKYNHSYSKYEVEAESYIANHGCVELSFFQMMKEVQRMLLENWFGFLPKFKGRNEETR